MTAVISSGSNPIKKDAFLWKANGKVYLYKYTLVPSGFVNERKCPTISGNVANFLLAIKPFPYDSSYRISGVLLKDNAQAEGVVLSTHNSKKYAWIDFSDFLEASLQFKRPIEPGEIIRFSFHLESTTCNNSDQVIIEFPVLNDSDAVLAVPALPKRTTTLKRKVSEVSKDIMVSEASVASVTSVVSVVSESPAKKFNLKSDLSLDDWIAEMSKKMPNNIRKEIIADFYRSMPKELALAIAFHST
jgi:hypothetical protein